MEKLKEIVEKSGGKIPEDYNVEHFVKNSTGAPPELPNLEPHTGPPSPSPLAGLLIPGAPPPPTLEDAILGDIFVVQLTSLGCCRF